MAEDDRNTGVAIDISSRCKRLPSDDQLCIDHLLIFYSNKSTIYKRDLTQIAI